MHIILSRLIWMGGEMRTAMARHLPAGTSWEDYVAGDGQTVVSIVLAELSENVIATIKTDPEILDYFFKADENGPLTETEVAKVQRSALRHGIPMNAMPDSPSVSDVAEAIKRRILLSQIMRDDDFTKADKIEKHALDRMKDAGFDADNLDKRDDPETRLKKIQKRKSRRDG